MLSMKTAACLVLCMLLAGAAQEQNEIEKEIERFLTGQGKDSTTARTKLRKGGPETLGYLIKARAEKKDSEKFQSLLDLIATVKKEQTKSKWRSTVFARLDSLKVPATFENAKVSDVLAYIEKGIGVKVMLDDAASHKAGEAVSFSALKAPVRDCLDAMAVQTGLDYDARYSGVFVSVPERLWPMPGSSVKPLPAENAWRSQKLGGLDAAVAKKLHTKRMGVTMEKVTLAHCFKIVGGTSGVPVTFETSASSKEISINVQSVFVGHVVEMLTIPNGLDARIEGGAVVVFDLEK